MASSKSTSDKETRTRTWTCVLYPDSVPENWKDLIDDMHIEWIESPLHDSDKNATGEFKKPHWHILLVFGGVKAYEQVKELTDALNAPIPERCHNAKAMVRYMAHLDNPDKAQYNISDIKPHGGVDLSEMLRPSSSERYTIISEMITYVKGTRITEFQDLMDYARQNEFDRWFPLLCDNSAYVVNQYIKSQKYRTCMIETNVVDENLRNDLKNDLINDLKKQWEDGNITFDEFSKKMQRFK